MNNDEIFNRLRLVAGIWTLTGRHLNRVIRVDRDALTVASDFRNRERTIPFRDIRSRPMRHGCIIDAIRQILGLNN